jgi:hypothetical protein
MKGDRHGRACRGARPTIPFGKRSLRRAGEAVSRLFGAFVVVGLVVLPASLEAAVQDVQATDVTPRAFAVVWASDEPVTNATVQVFNDALGTDEITADLLIAVVAPGGALAKGLAKVDIRGVREDTTYYYRVVSDGAGGQVVFPAAGDLPSVQTPSRVAIATASGGHLANVVLRDTQLAPDATTPAPDTLLLVDAPGVSAYPVSGFVGAAGLAAPDVVVDLNNLYAAATGESLALDAAARLQVTAYRGLDCPNLADHVLTRQRRDPGPLGGPAITRAEFPDTCFAPGGLSVDFDCNGTINAADSDAFAQQFGNATGTGAPSCAFHPDFDATGDRRVGVGDFNLLLSVFGEEE